MAAKISGLINTWNEAETIRYAMESLKTWCDEVLIVDQQWSDATVRIARRCGARVIEVEVHRLRGDHPRDVGGPDRARVGHGARLGRGRASQPGPPAAPDRRDRRGQRRAHPAPQHHPGQGDGARPVVAQRQAPLLPQGLHRYPRRDARRLPRGARARPRSCCRWIATAASGTSAITTSPTWSGSRSATPPCRPGSARARAGRRVRDAGSGSPRARPGRSSSRAGLEGWARRHRVSTIRVMDRFLVQAKQWDELASHDRAPEYQRMKEEMLGLEHDPDLAPIDRSPTWSSWRGRPRRSARSSSSHGQDLRRRHRAQRGAPAALRAGHADALVRRGHRRRPAQRGRDSRDRRRRWVPRSTSTIAPAASPTRRVASRFARPPATGSSSSMPTRWCRPRWPRTCASSSIRDPPIDVVLVPRANVILGRWIRHGNNWPSRHARFFRPGSLLMTDRIHKSIAPAPGTRRHKLAADPDLAIWHFPGGSLSDLVRKVDRYTDIEARQAYARGRRVNGPLGAAHRRGHVLLAPVPPWPRLPRRHHGPGRGPHAHLLPCPHRGQALGAAAQEGAGGGGPAGARAPAQALGRRSALHPISDRNRGLTPPSELPLAPATGRDIDLVRGPSWRYRPRARPIVSIRRRRSRRSARDPALTSRSPASWCPGIRPATLVG